MAVFFARLSWGWLAGKEKEQVSNGTSMNSINSLGLIGEPEALTFHWVKGNNSKMPPSSSNRKPKGKWKSREERRRIVKEYDLVVVPSDGVCSSGSESDDSDWSIAWLEPHATDFQSEDEVGGSFAVLVPCYRLDCKEFEGVEEEEDGTGNQFTSAIRNLPNQYSAEGKKKMEQWLYSFSNY